MSHQQLNPAVPALLAEREASLPVLTHGHRGALDRLGTAFAEARPVAILVGECKSGASYIIDRFLASIEGDVAVARITESCSDDIECMHAVAQAAGFDSQDMGLAELENDFTSFLSYQRHNNRRTIICFEETQNSESWVLDRVRRLVELEAKEKFGIMVILSGRPSLNKSLAEAPFDVIGAHAGQRIAHARLTLAETREYISREIKAADVAEISQVFEFNAITLIHELCSGVPDSIDALCCKCIELANREDSTPVTTNIVQEAFKLLSQERTLQKAKVRAESVRANGASVPIGRLIAHMNGVVVHERALSEGHILIGRGKLCDIPLANRAVSRMHALVVDSPTGLSLVDLGSKNGTFVNGRQIEQHALQNGDVIAVGDCTIAYVGRNERQS